MFRGEEAETICVCKEGFSGDPDSQRGCNEQTDKSTVRPKEGCIVKNETYAVGEEWDDGCEYKCSCSKKLEILCQVSGFFCPKVDSLAPAAKVGGSPTDHGRGTR